MMADRVLRDHSQPCEHLIYQIGDGSRYFGHVSFGHGRCPGGREVTEAEIIAEYLGRTNATGGNVDAPAI